MFSLVNKPVPLHVEKPCLQSTPDRQNSSSQILQKVNYSKKKLPFSWNLTKLGQYSHHLNSQSLNVDYIYLRENTFTMASLHAIGFLSKHK